jgi:hypothetical protein
MAIDDEIRELVDAFTRRLNADLDTTIRGFAGELRTRFESAERAAEERRLADISRAVDDARQQAERAFEERLTRTRAEMNADFEGQRAAQASTHADVTSRLERELTDARRVHAEAAALLENQIASERRARADATADFERQLQGVRETHAEARSQLENQLTAERSARTDAVAEIEGRLHTARETHAAAIGQLEGQVIAERSARSDVIAELEGQVAAARAAHSEIVVQHEGQLAAERSARADIATQLSGQVAAERAGRAEVTTRLENQLASERRARTEVTTQLELQLAAERADLAAARASLKETGRTAGAEALSRLLTALRRVDQANSLVNILGALAKGAAAHTSRVVIFIVEGGQLRAWGHFGFSSTQAPADLPLGQAGDLAKAVERKQAISITAETPVAGPAFMSVPEGRAGVILPVLVGSEVVALLYADDVDRLADQADAPLWTEEIEFLVRHAALRLENVTSTRTVEVLTGRTRQS